jgi:hypothetical protein
MAPVFAGNREKSARTKAQAGLHFRAGSQIIQMRIILIKEGG